MSDGLQIPEWATDYMEPAFYKVAYGGRSSTKSQTFMRLILLEMLTKGRSVGCFREIQKSIKDSIKKSLDQLMDEIGWRQYFHSTDTEIRCKLNTSVMIFAGLKHNVTNVKGMDWLDIAFCEEAENISEDSWNVLEPTFRDGDSEIWVAFNPKFETDATYRRFVLNPPPEYMPEHKGGRERYALIKKVNYHDNPWFDDTASYAQMKLMQREDPELHRHIWLGEPLRDTELSIIKPLWIDAAIDAHKKLGIEPTGNRFAGFDPADEGEDFNALAYRDGVILNSIREWKDRDSVAAGEWVYWNARDIGVMNVSYDNIGVGAGVKGKFRDIERDLISRGDERLVRFTEFTANAKPVDGEYMPGRENADHFLDLKAQAWWNLRDRFHNTYKAIVEGKDVDMEKIVSIDSEEIDRKLLDKLKMELASPNREYSNGKIKVEGKDKLKKRGIPSPNIADAICMAFDPQNDQGYDLGAW